MIVSTKEPLFTEQARFFYKEQVIDNTEELHFYGTGTLFYKEQVIDNTEELDFYGRSARQSTQRSQIF